MRRIAVVVSLLIVGAASPALGQEASTSTAQITAPEAQSVPESCREGDAECTKRLAAAYDAIDSGRGGPTDANLFGGTEDAAPGLITLMVKTVLVLGIVCALIYLLLGKLLPKLMRVKPFGPPRNLMTVVDRLPIDQRRSIMIIQTGEKYFLVGVTDNGINLISRLDGDDLDTAIAEVAQRESKPNGLTSLFFSRSQKET